MTFRHLYSRYGWVILVAALALTGLAVGLASASSASASVLPTGGPTGTNLTGDPVSSPKPTGTHPSCSNGYGQCPTSTPTASVTGLPPITATPTHAAVKPPAARVRVRTHLPKRLAYTGITRQLVELAALGVALLFVGSAISYAAHRNAPVSEPTMPRGDRARRH